MSFDQLHAELQARKAQSLYRQRRILQSPQSPQVMVDGKACLAFCSNDYLGLANHPEVIAGLKAGADRYGVGGGASHLVNGHSQAHHALEEELADFTGRPRALLFSTGYMANIGAITALLDKRDGVFQDRVNHASLLDGGLLSGARFQRFLHNDADNLNTRLQRTDARRKLVVCDGVFSMDGDLAELPTICDTAAQHKAWVMVDDAHGFGCIGAQGRGTVDHFGLGNDDVQILVGTLGKAFGTSGAFVAGSEELIETLIQHARTYIYTTSMSPAVAAATRVSLKLLQQDEWRRDKLNDLILRFRQGCEQLGLPVMASATPIQPIMVGAADRAMAISAALEAKGIYIGAIRPPTVPEGGARLRVTFSATHTDAQLDRLLDALDEVMVGTSGRAN
ncbi:8-amino-7-oxononanoate synthase [Amphritea sp. 2_MG-2023]|uniref:8-amino-7-oxononanoate synthase n=1 Tax=Amphritea TaxID=515417 RepID=UPI001C07CD46|nr:MULTISPECIES: 8-amino-7-oxononanoate synthase [Amphritea]MBU2965066.1 8-amino-7-oxononanoate synthase [Amphritea atlantica]MDO6418851.1 8-amino-7-oxononanoate synthase [Amphritea sp. 2_MG-2023]